MSISIIVGGSKGIGLVIARLMRARGDQTLVLSRSTGEWDGDHIAVDLADAASVQTAIHTLKERSHKISYMIFAQKNRLHPQSTKYEITVSTEAVQAFVESLVPEAAIQSVVLLGSPAGTFIVSEQPAAYHVGKAALEHLSRYYAVNLGKYGTTFNCVLPGTILKDANRKFFDDNPDITGLLKKITPLGVLGDASDIANAVAFFCSEKARYITGQTIFVDGGQSLQGQESLARRLTNLDHPNAKK